MRLRITTASGEVAVNAIMVPGVNGLAVHRGNAVRANMWAVTHTHSGLAILHVWDKDDALVALMDLAVCGEWDVPAALLSKTTKRRANRIKKDLGIAGSGSVVAKDHPAMTRVVA